jgi:ADP-dependent NAD(P)H-hydrate dehydratase / NAD(P)H-hydrate epimerase
VRPIVRVVTSLESAARDASAIAAGIPSRALMQRAGAAAAAEIALRFHERLDEGILILAGPGNNGGDAWVVARALATTGARVSVIEPVEAKTEDARAERALAREFVESGPIPAGIVVDGLFGTGGRGRMEGAFADAVTLAKNARAGGAAVVALDLPSGIDATTGERSDCVAADLTLTFGSIKRGHLVNRDLCGTIVVLDIGLGAHADLDDAAPRLVDDLWADARLPRVRANTHKGERKKLAIVGGHAGMAGAVLLAARGAFRSGIGMVKLIVARESLPVIQEAEPQALAAVWPEDDASVESDIGQWADAVVIGPGLGRDETSYAVLDRILRVWRGPVLVDADALTRFTGEGERLAQLLVGRAAIVTPHVVEFSRISGIAREEVELRRFDVGAELARRLNATVLVKGVPTVISSPTGERLVSATGTPALGTGGSGDVLSGVVGTLLAQTGDAFTAGALGAFAHGRAAERIVTIGGTRGTTLDDVIAELRGVWAFDVQPLRYPVLAELPALP